MTDPTAPMTSRAGAPSEGTALPRVGPSDVVPAVEPTERILGAAEQCFCDLGYDGTSVRTIAQLAGVSKSLVLYHFQSKEQLYAEVQTRVYERVARWIRESVAVRGGTVVERGLVAFDALSEAVRERNDLAAQAMLGARALSS
ncbi:MAG: TetR/AcrR family transcriptional regulator, partial [Myxococcota bacterium]